MLYYSYLGLGISELGPKNREEFSYCVAFMILSAFTFNYAFGQISGLYNSLVADSIRTQNELDAMNSIIMNFEM